MPGRVVYSDVVKIEIGTKRLCAVAIFVQGNKQVVVPISQRLSVKNRGVVTLGIDSTSRGQRIIIGEKSRRRSVNGEADVIFASDYYSIECYPRSLCMTCQIVGITIEQNADL
jgi:hypothetical protein